MIKIICVSVKGSIADAGLRCTQYIKIMAPGLWDLVGVRCQSDSTQPARSTPLFASQPGYFISPACDKLRRPTPIQ